MIITLTRTGGFTGIPFKKTIDTSKIDPEKAKEIEKMIAKVPKGSEEPAEPKVAAKPGAEWYPDRFSYTISLQNGEQSQEVKLDEASLNLDIKTLIIKLEES